jgi:hypothetical protein
MEAGELNKEIFDECISVMGQNVRLDQRFTTRAQRTMMGAAVPCTRARDGTAWRGM